MNRRALAVPGATALVGAVALIAAMQVAAMPVAGAAPAWAHACTQAPAKGHATCFALKRTDVKGHKGVTTNAIPSGYGPADIQSAYKLPAASGSPTVAIVDAYDDPNAESDLGIFRAQYGLPACTSANGCFTKVNQNGQTSPLPAGDTGWAGEISLDVDAVSSACPACHILLVEASDASDNLYTAVNTARTLGARFISMSWGGSEFGSENSYDSQYFNHPGIVYTASSGDSGYSGGVIYPSTSQYVVSVGGTSLSPASNARGWSESVWNGAGSGCSSDVTKPAWQSSISACGYRTDTDVSAVADPATGLAVYQTYGGSGWSVYGGTSLSSPLIASIYALAGTPGAADHPNSYPYAHPGNLFDVTSGSNGSCATAVLCQGGTGWDGPSGLGTPNGTAAFTAGGGGGSSPVTVSKPANQSGTVGTAVSLQLSAAGGTPPYTWSATGLPTGLSINASSGLISGTPTTANSYTVTVTATDSTNVSGSAQFSWAISSPGGCSGQKLVNPGFESGSTGWTATAGVINSDGTYAHSGRGYVWLDGYGTTHTDTLSQSVAIPSGCSANLTYYLWIQSSETTPTIAYDKLTLTANGTAVQSFSNLNKGTGYVPRSVNLSSYAGQTVTLKWTGTEDASLQTSFFIDDTALNLS